MKKFKIGEKYTDKDGNSLVITGVDYYNVRGDAVHFTSDTKVSGLIDGDGLYFMSNSEYAKLLTLVS